MLVNWDKTIADLGLCRSEAAHFKCMKYLPEGWVRNAVGVLLLSLFLFDIREKNLVRSKSKN